MASQSGAVAAFVCGLMTDPNVPHIAGKPSAILLSQYYYIFI